MIYVILCISRAHQNPAVEGIEPLANNIVGIKRAITALFELNLSPEIKTDLNSINKYLASFECILMTSVWHKILTAINYVSTILQGTDITIDIEIKNLESLLDNLKNIRDNWCGILQDCKISAEKLGTEPDFSKNQRKKNINSEELFKRNVFYVVMDNLICGITTRFEAAAQLNSLFEILWKFNDFDNETIIKKANI